MNHLRNSEDSTVRLIDDFNKTEIQFAESKVQIRDEVIETGVGGLCNNSRNGAHLRWALWADDASEQPVLYGESFCAGGQFSLGLIDLDHVICGLTHRLEVEGDWGGMAHAELEKRCQPLASEPVGLSEGILPPGTECAIEYVPSSGSENSCSQVCYRDNKVVYSSAVAALRCSNLMQKLAQPLTTSL